MRAISAIQRLVRKDIDWLGDPPSSQNREDGARKGPQTRPGQDQGQWRGQAEEACRTGARKKADF